MGYEHPGELFLGQYNTIDSHQDVLQYAVFLRKEAGVGADPPIDLNKIYGRFEMPKPGRVALPRQQGLLLDAEKGLILVNSTDPYTRQRFSEAHELIELLFSVLPVSNSRLFNRVGNFKPGVKETLCNEGAAELLMPRESFRPAVAMNGISYQTAQSLAPRFQVSTAAALVHMTRLSPACHAVVLFRMKNKPSEVRAKVADEQMSIFGERTEALPVKKLRVEWSLRSAKMPYIPTHKSVSEDSLVYDAWVSGSCTSGDEYGLLGISPRIYCENHPFQVDDEKQVLSLLCLL